MTAELNIPDFMPMLRSGVGSTPKDGGCIMQVVDFLDRGDWTDKTPCVHPALRSAAIHVNDYVTDEDRQKLYPLVPRLMGTSAWVGDKMVSVKIAVWCARRVLHLVREQDRQVNEAAIVAAERWIEDPSAAAANAYAADAAYAANAANAYAANAADANAADAAAAAAANAAYAAYAANAAAANAADANAVANAAYAAAAAADADAYAAAAYAANAAAYAAADAAAAYAANAAAYAADAADAAEPRLAASAQRLTDFIALLDEFDRITGRTEFPKVTDQEWRRVAEAVNA